MGKELFVKINNDTFATIVNDIQDSKCGMSELQYPCDEKAFMILVFLMLQASPNKTILISADQIAEMIGRSIRKKTREEIICNLFYLQNMECIRISEMSTGYLITINPDTYSIKSDYCSISQKEFNELIRMENSVSKEKLLIIYFYIKQHFNKDYSLICLSMDDMERNLGFSRHSIVSGVLDLEYTLLEVLRTMITYTNGTSKKFNFYRPLHIGLEEEIDVNRVKEFASGFLSNVKSIVMI